MPLITIQQAPRFAAMLHRGYYTGSDQPRTAAEPPATTAPPRPESSDLMHRTFRAMSVSAALALAVLAWPASAQQDTTERDTVRADTGAFQGYKDTLGPQETLQVIIP